MNNPIKINIAMPLGKSRLLRIETAMYCIRPISYGNIMMSHTDTLSPASSRNCLIEGFLEGDSDYLFFVDSDVVPPEDAAQKLLALDVDVAAGIYNIMISDEIYWDVRSNGVYISTDSTLPDKPFKIDGAGGGCLMIKREVLEKMEYPWFDLELQRASENDGVFIKRGEDVYFIEKAIENGFSVVAHPEVVCDHYNVVNLRDVRKKTKG